jgi:hypothetical protein
MGSTLWHAVAAGSFSWRLLCWSFLAGVMCAAIGTAFLSATAPRPQRASEPITSLSAWLAGFILASSMLLILSFISPFGIDVDCAVLVLAAICSLAFRVVRTGWRHLSLGRLDLLVLLLVLLSAGFWSQENIAALDVGASTVVARPWVDAFVHATHVSLFAHADGAAHLYNPWVAGRPVRLYHYGSYMMASLLCRLTGLDAYSLAVGWYAPMGLLLTGLAAWALGSSLLGPWGGLGAVCFALLIPDPSYYGLGNRWTSYFFFQSVGIGGAYAVAVLGMSWALFFTYMKTGSRRRLVAAFLLNGLSVLFKAQIFLVYSFGLLVFTALSVPRLRWPPRALLLVACVLAVFFAGAVLPHVPNAPTLKIDPSQAGVNLDKTFHNFPPPLKAWLREQWRDLPSHSARLRFGAAVVLTTTYGIWLVALPFGFGRSATAGLPRWAWAGFPLLMLANHLFVALCLAPNTSGGWDAHEVVHKTFVFPYFAVTAWSGAALFATLAGPPSGTRRRKLCLIAISVAALAVVYTTGKTVQSGMLWSRNATRLGLPRGLYDAACFIREHTRTGSVVQYSENDGFAMLTALGERPSYIVHGNVNAPAPDSEQVLRMQEVGQLLALPTGDAVRERAAALGIDWLLLSPDRQPPWAAQLRFDFESQGFRLFHLARESPGRR